MMKRDTSFGGSHRGSHPERKNRTLPAAAGLTLIELILACAILAILSAAAVPLAKVTVQRAKEKELHLALREMRTAIDRYKDDADKNRIRTEVGSENYPPDMETLVSGVNVVVQAGAVPGAISAATLATQSSGSASQAAGPSAASSSVSQTPTKVRYLRKIPIDPMTGKADWGLRSVQDDADSDSWGGQDVFDVYSKSEGTALDGTKYKDW
jgi:general secretion pathway protein G